MAATTTTAASMRSTAPPRQSQTADAGDGEQQHERPEVAEALLQGGAEEAPPDVGVGEVVGDRERVAALELLGLGERADVDEGERGAGDDQVARVPEPSADDETREPGARGAQGPRGAPLGSPERREHDHADRQRPHGRDDGQLGAEREPGGEAGDEQRAPGRRLARVQQDRDRADAAARSRPRRCWRCPAGARRAGWPTSAPPPRQPRARRRRRGARSTRPRTAPARARPGSAAARGSRCRAAAGRRRAAARRPGGRTSSGRAGR